MSKKKILSILICIILIVASFIAIKNHKKKIKNLRHEVIQIQNKNIQQQEEISSLKIDNAAYAKFVASYLPKYENDLANITSEDYLNANKEFSPYEKVGFCIITASYNNAAYAKQNINSVFRQTYHNWRLIYIDDSSDDGMSEIVSQIKKDSNLSDNKFKLIRNPERLRSALTGTYYAAHNFCKNEEVMVFLDGDDLLATPNTLNELADIYKDGKTWATHGQFVNSTDGTLGYCCNHDISEKDWSNLRKMPWSFSHLRTTYTWLFKKIKKEDFQYNNKFINSCGDLPVMFPVAEMAGKDRMKFVRDITYIFRLHIGSEQTLHLKEQHFNENYIRNLPKYEQLDSDYVFQE